MIGIDPRGTNALEGLEIVAEPYRVEHLSGARLAFAAATLEINREVVRDANRAGIFVNSASEPGNGDFRLPIARREGPILLTISTSGASPALGRRLLAPRRIARSRLGTPARILGELRHIIINKYHEIKIRRLIFDDWADLDRLELLARQDDDAIRLALLERAARIAEKR